MRNFIITIAVIFIFIVNIVGQDINLKISSNINNHGLDYYAKTYEKWAGVGETSNLGISDNITASNYYIILDSSGSMMEYQCTDGKTKMETAKNAVSEWVRNIPPSDNIALAMFGNYSLDELLPLERNTARFMDKFKMKMNNISASGSTPLGGSLKGAYSMLRAQAQKQIGYGEYHIVVVTDGMASDYEIMVEALEKIYDTPIILHTIGFCMGTDHPLNKPGKSFYMSAMSKEELQNSLQKVLAESETFDINGFSN